MTQLERSTQQRTAIMAVFRDSLHPLLPADVLNLASQRCPGLGIATVYRTIKALLAEGWLQTVNLPGETARYELQDRPHHHHFQCRSCGQVFDIPGCPGSLEHLAPAGFRVDGHELTLYGHCHNCSRPEATARPQPAPGAGPGK